MKNRILACFWFRNHAYSAVRYLFVRHIKYCFSILFMLLIRNPDVFLWIALLISYKHCTFFMLNLGLYLQLTRVTLPSFSDAVVVLFLLGSKSHVFSRKAWLLFNMMYGCFTHHFHCYCYLDRCCCWHSCCFIIVIICNFMLLWFFLIAVNRK